MMPLWPFWFLSWSFMLDLCLLYLLSRFVANYDLWCLHAIFPLTCLDVLSTTGAWSTGAMTHKGVCCCSPLLSRLTNKIDMIGTFQPIGKHLNYPCTRTRIPFCCISASCLHGIAIWFSSGFACSMHRRGDHSQYICFMLYSLPWPVTGDLRMWTANINKY